MRVLVTGAEGFIGKNLRVRLGETGIEAELYTRDMGAVQLSESLNLSDFVFHLAGINRPNDESEFTEGNVELTDKLCELIRKSGRKIPVLFSSSIQAEQENPYGASKLNAEKVLCRLGDETGCPIYIYRLPNVFGKWSRPNYNSVVATFCHNIAKGVAIKINDPAHVMRLAYIDDVVDDFLDQMKESPKGVHWPDVSTVYTISVGDLAKHIETFKDSRETMITAKVGSGLSRALYSTYLSFLKTEQFSYPLPKHEDPRGVFVEMLKTLDSGQFSYFSAHPGVTRGGHYHHSKAEKFLVIKGNASFRFRNIITDEYYELFTSGGNPEIVETVPGWSHDITNVGEDEMLVLLWANEIFNPENPDTYSMPVRTKD